MAYAKDEREAARLFKLAADQGNASAQNSLGVFLCDGPWRPAPGRPVKPPASSSSPPNREMHPGRTVSEYSMRRAVAACPMTRSRGRAPFQALCFPREMLFGQHSLGFFCATGRGGLRQDDREATRLFKLAADQGNADGQVSLGVMYQYGRGGLSKDDGAAARLFKARRRPGDASAQVSLGNLAKTQIDNLYAAVPKKRWARWLLRWLVPRKVRREFDNVFKFAGGGRKRGHNSSFSQQRHGCGRAGAMRLAIEVGTGTSEKLRHGAEKSVVKKRRHRPRCRCSIFAPYANEPHLRGGASSGTPSNPTPALNRPSPQPRRAGGGILRAVAAPS